MVQRKDYGYVPPKLPVKPTNSDKRGYVPSKPPVKPPEKPKTGKK